jgi:hypothetical protein
MCNLVNASINKEQAHYHIYFYLTTGINKTIYFCPPNICMNYENLLILYRSIPQNPLF